MFEHPQFTHDRYTQEMHRVEERLELIRVVNERRESDAGRSSEPRRRGWFRWRPEPRAARAETTNVAPVIPAGVGSAASAAGR